jgi:hypothetical protein
MAARYPFREVILMGSISVPLVAAAGADATATGVAAAGGADAAATAAALTAGEAASVSAGAASTALAGSTLGSAATAGSVFTMGNAAAAAGLLGSVGSAVSQRQAGIATDKEDRRKALQAQLDASQKQITMRQNMLRALASQNAGTLGAVGTGRGTSFGANALRQITQNQNDLAANQADESAQVSLLDQAGSNAASAGSFGAASALGSGAAAFAKNFNTGS